MSTEKNTSAPSAQEKSNPPGFPEGLPLLPEPKEGFRWEYRGAAWKHKGESTVAFSPIGGSWEVHSVHDTVGFLSYHYAELVPIKPAVRRFKRIIGFNDFKLLEFRDPSPDSIGHMIFDDGVEAESGFTLKYALECVAKNLWIELPVDTEPDYFSDEAQLAARRAWAENPNIEKEAWSESRGWTRADSSWYSAVKYRLRPAPPKPPEPKRVPLDAEDFPPILWVRPADQPWNMYLVIEVNPSQNEVRYSQYGCTFADLMDDGFEMSTDRINWKPCSKLVKEGGE